MAVEMVYITHPNTEAVGHVVRSAFDGEHAAKGWSIIDEADVDVRVNEETGEPRFFRKAPAAAPSSIALGKDR